MLFEVASTASIVAVTLVAPALAAVTVTLVPTVRPVRLNVGVLSLVTLSEFDVPVSEAEFRVGAVGVAIVICVVALEVAVALLTELVPVLRTRMYFPTSALAKTYVLEVAPLMLTQVPPLEALFDCH
jgi:hypothetical protein